MRRLTQKDRGNTISDGNDNDDSQNDQHAANLDIGVRKSCQERQKPNTSPRGCIVASNFWKQMLALHVLMLRCENDLLQDHGRLSSRLSATWWPIEKPGETQLQLRFDKCFWSSPLEKKRPAACWLIFLLLAHLLPAISSFASWNSWAKGNGILCTSRTVGRAYPTAILLLQRQLICHWAAWAMFFCANFKISIAICQALAPWLPHGRAHVHNTKKLPSYCRKHWEEYWR